MRIMTSNIWGDFFNNPTTLRDDKLYSIYKKYDPDVLGFQEVTKSWYDSSLFKNLSSDYYFVGTDLADGVNYVPLAIKKEFFLLEKGFEYFEKTPDDSKAVTWAVLRQKDFVFAVCNVHFWWMRGTESEEVKRIKGVLDFSFEDHCKIRAENARQLTNLMKYLQERYSCPVFAFGDMNAAITESVFDVYEQNGVRKLFDLAEQKDYICTVHGDPTRGTDGEFHGVEATEAYISSFRKVLCLPKITDNSGYLTSIDHIVALGDNFKILQYRVVTDQPALDATDHSPTYADVKF